MDITGTYSADDLEEVMDAEYSVIDVMVDGKPEHATTRALSPYRPNADGTLPVIDLVVPAKTLAFFRGTYSREDVARLVAQRIEGLRDELNQRLFELGYIISEGNTWELYHVGGHKSMEDWAYDLGIDRSQSHRATSFYHSSFYLTETLELPVQEISAKFTARKGLLLTRMQRKKMNDMEELARTRIPNYLQLPRERKEDIISGLVTENLSHFQAEARGILYSDDRVMDAQQTQAAGLPYQAALRLTKVTRDGNRLIGMFELSLEPEDLSALAAGRLRTLFEFPGEEGTWYKTTEIADMYGETADSTLDD